MGTERNEIAAQEEMINEIVSEYTSVVKGILDQKTIPELSKLPMSFELIITAMTKQNMPLKIQAILLSTITINVIKPYLEEYKRSKLQEDGLKPDDPAKNDEDWRMYV